MPQGKGTYGKQVGRPPKKYKSGGSVDPFSLRNPRGVPAEQMAEVMEDQNMANEGIPTANAQERSQVSSDTTSYKEGGKVKFKEVDVTDVVKETEKSSVRYQPDSSETFQKQWGGGKYTWEDATASARHREGVKRKRASVRSLAEKALKGKNKYGVGGKVKSKKVTAPIPPDWNPARQRYDEYGRSIPWGKPDSSVSRLTKRKASEFDATKLKGKKKGKKK